MDLKQALRDGMRVVGPDDRAYGTVDRYDEAAVYVQGRRVPFVAIERLDQDRLYLNTPELWSLSESDTASRGLDDEIRVPLLEEKVEFGTREVDLGEIRVHKTVEETEEVRRGPLNREVVQIERVKVNRPIADPEERRQEGDWLVIPIMEEIFIVQKQLMVTEEIRIRKHLVTDEHEVREVVRRERATIEDTRPAPPPSVPGRTASGQTGNDSAWEALREEIRDADR